MKTIQKTAWILRGVAVLFVVLTIAFLMGVWGRPPELYIIPLVDSEFTKTDTVRQSYGDLLRAEADMIEFECYLCHDEGEPPPLRFDENHKLIIPDEHSNIVMNHGQHDRNNNCFNCHSELNLLTFETRDGRELGFEDSTQLCGSCHGPTYRDWEAGAHGRSGGYWNENMGERTRQDCVSCHDPHLPGFPSRAPAPRPHPLHMAAEPAAAEGQPEH